MARKSKKQGKKTVDLSLKLKNIQALVATNRSKEAIAYQYMFFTMLCAQKYGVVKKPYQSIKDYAMLMVKEHGLSPENVYPFVQQVESIIYGGRQPSTEAYKETLIKFSKVFKEITGKDLPLRAE